MNQANSKITYLEILQDSLIRKIKDKAKRNKLAIYLVGGFLRDLLLNRKRDNFDIDFAVSKNALNFTKSLAKELKSPFVLLDKEHGSCRIVYKFRGEVLTLDFTDFRGKTLKEDLLHRDFTVNTLAMDLDNTNKESIIDFYEGKNDLAKKVIKVAHKKTFDEDPIRILRSFSMSAMLGFEIENKTLGLIKQKSKKIRLAAAERVLDELFKILASQRAYVTLEQMDKVKFLSYIFPEIEKMRGVDQGPYHHLDVWQHSLAAVGELEKFLVNIDKARLKHGARLKDYLNQSLAANRKRFALLKLGALLHDLGKPSTRIVDKDGRRIFHGHEHAGIKILEQILKRLKISNQEGSSLKRMMLHHLRPGYLSDHKSPSSRSVFRYFRDAADDAVAILVLSLADARATRGPFKSKADLAQHERIIFKLIDEFYDEKTRVKPKKIINGHQLMKALKIKEGPLVGDMLFKIQEAQAEGKIKDKMGAIIFAKKCIK